MSWPLVSLNEICDLVNGYAFKSSDYVPQSNTLSCRMSNIRPDGNFDINYNARYLPDEFSNKYKNFLLKDNDIVIAMTDLADSPKILGVPTVVYTSGKNILLNQRVGKLVIRDEKKVFFPYLKFALNDPKVRAIYKKFAGGGLQINLGKNDLLNVQIYLPPLEAQKRIAAILDKADAVRRKRQQTIELSEQLLRSVFLDMFGDPVTNPKGWNIEPLSKVVSSLEGGKNIKPADSNINAKNRILKVSAVTSGVYRYSESKPLPANYEPPNSYFVKKGDLLISRANTSELIGASAYVHDTPENIVLPDKIWKINWKNLDNIDPLFIHFLMSQPAIRRAISNRASGTSGSMKNIPKPKLLEIEIPLPPSTEQKKFGEIACVVYKMNNHFQSSIVNYEKLFNSLAQQAFNGELSKHLEKELA